jgi:hypothetical protein
MGRDLTRSKIRSKIDNTRQVLFEKTQLYYYKKTNAGLCLEECNFIGGNYNDIEIDSGINIGSCACGACPFNKGYDYENGFIICNRLAKAISKNG